MCHNMRACYSKLGFLYAISYYLHQYQCIICIYTYNYFSLFICIHVSTSYVNVIILEKFEVEYTWEKSEVQKLIMVMRLFVFVGNFTPLCFYFCKNTRLQLFIIKNSVCLSSFLCLTKKFFFSVLFFQVRVQVTKMIKE